MYSHKENYSPKCIHWLYILFKAEVIQILETVRKQQRQNHSCTLFYNALIIKDQISLVMNSNKDIKRK